MWSWLERKKAREAGSAGIRAFRRKRSQQRSSVKTPSAENARITQRAGCQVLQIRDCETKSRIIFLS
jgi:hypothetical protein